MLGYQNLNQNRFDQVKFNLNVDLVRLRINEKTFLNHTPYTLLELSFLFSYETNILNEAAHPNLSDYKEDLKAAIYSQKNNDEIYLKNFCKYLNIDFD